MPKTKKLKKKQDEARADAEISRAADFSVRVGTWTAVGLFAGGAVYMIAIALTLALTRTLGDSWPLMAVAGMSFGPACFMYFMSQRPLYKQSGGSIVTTSKGVAAGYQDGTHAAVIEEMEAMMSESPTGPIPVVS